MKLFQANSRERLALRIYDRRGRAIRRSPRRLSRFLRCLRTGKRRRIHWRLIRTLYRVSRIFKGRTLVIYSGYRHRSVSRLKRSRHIAGRAVDFRVAGVTTRRLRDVLLKKFKNVGVGYYPNTPFVHLDVRARRAFWVDFSASGEDSRYAKNPYRLLRRQRRTGTRMKEPAKRKVLVIIDEKGGRSPRPVGPEPLTARSAGEKSAPAAPRAPVPRAPASGGKPPISMAE